MGGRGWTGELAGAAAREHAKFLSCDGECDSTERVMPPDSTVYGGHARVGHQWDVFGVQAGATVYQDFESNTDRTATVRVLPDVEVSVRHHDRVRAVLGLGSPTVQTLIRPGLYTGAEVALDAVEIGATVGAFRSGPGGDAALRADVTALLPLSPTFKLKIAGGVSSNERGGPGGEGALGAVAAF
jgi:hypothetical protein